jgi:hypothetical protein
LERCIHVMGTTSKVMVSRRPRVSFWPEAAPVPEIKDGSCRVCKLVTALQLLLVLIYKCSVHPVIGSNPMSGH